MGSESISEAIYDVYADFMDCIGSYTLNHIHRGEFPSPHVHTCLFTSLSRDIVVIINRASVIVSDILVVAATWYYISHTCSVRGQLVCDVWAARPNLTTVMFRDGEY